MAEDVNNAILTELRRLTDAIDRLAGPAPAANDWKSTWAYNYTLPIQAAPINAAPTKIRTV